MSFFGNNNDFDDFDDFDDRNDCNERASCQDRVCLSTSTDRFDNMETDIKESMATFQSLMDRVLDAYNEGGLSQEEMGKYLKDGKYQLERSKKLLEEIVKLREGSREI